MELDRTLLVDNDMITLDELLVFIIIITIMMVCFSNIAVFVSIIGSLVLDSTTEWNISTRTWNPGMIDLGQSDMQVLYFHGGSVVRFCKLCKVVLLLY